MADTFRAAIELRDGGADSPGRLSGVLMVYGVPGVHGREVFAAGALRWPDNGIRIDLDHASSPVRGSVQPPLMPHGDPDRVRRRRRGPDRFAELPDTQAARDLAVLMRAVPPVYSGAVSRVSPAARASRRRAARDRRCRVARRRADRHAGLSRYARGGPRRRAEPAAAARHLAMAVKQHPLDPAGLAAALYMPAKPMIDARRLLSVAESLVTAYLHDDRRRYRLSGRASETKRLSRTAGHVHEPQGIRRRRWAREGGRPAGGRTGGAVRCAAERRRRVAGAVRDGGSA